MGGGRAEGLPGISGLRQKHRGRSYRRVRKPQNAALWRRGVPKAQDGLVKSSAEPLDFHSFFEFPLLIGERKSIHFICFAEPALLQGGTILSSVITKIINQRFLKYRCWTIPTFHSPSFRAVVSSTYDCNYKNRYSFEESRNLSCIWDCSAFQRPTRDAEMLPTITREISRLFPTYYSYHFPHSAVYHRSR